MIQYIYLGGGLRRGLRLQAEVAALVAEGDGERAAAAGASTVLTLGATRIGRTFWRLMKC